MAGSRILKENMMDVNRLLLKASLAGATLFYGLCFLLQFTGNLPGTSLVRLTIAAIAGYAIYGLTALAYQSPRLREYFHYLFPIEMFATVALSIFVLKSPPGVFFIWLIPVIYSGLYAHRGTMLICSGLVLVAAPVIALFSREGHWTNHLAEVLLSTVVMLIIILRLVSLVSRSRMMIRKTEGEVENTGGPIRTHQRCGQTRH